MFASLVALLLALFAGPVAGAGTVPLVQEPAGAVVGHSSQGPSARPVPGVTGPEVSAPTDVPHSHPATVAPPADVAEQLPQETNGRLIDCPDGVHVGVMVDGAVTGCP